MRVKGPVSYDERADVLYILGHEGPVEEFVEPVPGVHVELDAQGKIIGIEILNASKTLDPLLEGLRTKV